MLGLRPYKACDAEKIVSWIKDKDTFNKWSAGRFDAFPVTEKALNKKYLTENGNCPEDNFYPFTAFDENGIAGSITMRFTDVNKEILRLGFVIVDSEKRGKGYGKKMMELALKYAFEIMKVKRVTIGVLENNLSAIKCYKSVGFKEYGEEFFCISGESWRYINMENVSNE